MTGADEHLTAVVSFGHAEYGVPVLELLRDGDPLWEPIVDDDLDDIRDEPAALEREFDRRNPAARVRDWDLAWETIYRLDGSREQFEKALGELVAELRSVSAISTDDAFDYWPSGVRLAREVAEVLDGGTAGAHSRATAAVVRSIAAERGLPLDDIGVENLDPRPRV